MTDFNLQAKSVFRGWSIFWFNDLTGLVSSGQESGQ
jgi:hypothetical protein